MTASSSSVCKQPVLYNNRPILNDSQCLFIKYIMLVEIHEYGVKINGLHADGYPLES